MRKELVIHLFYFVIFFGLITVFKRTFTPIYLLFWLGGFIGTILPDIDHLIYVYFLQPHELTSQRAQSGLAKGDVSGTMNLLISTRDERSSLIFHSIWFQLLFFGITFFVLSSTTSKIAQGIVIAFSLHLLVDQFADLSRTGSLASWFSQIRMTLSREKSLFYSLFLLLVLLILAFLVQ